MPADLPRLFLARHGDTAWTDSRQRTGRTDLPLNERGEEHARQLRERLQRFSFARIFTSPLQRASKTCALAGFGEVAEKDPDLMEWDYGRFEGKLTREILKELSRWELFRYWSHWMILLRKRARIRAMCCFILMNIRIHTKSRNISEQTLVRSNHSCR